MAYNNNFRSALPISNIGGYGGSQTGAVPPPLPPRNYNTPTTGYSGGYSPYGSSIGFGGIGSLGGYGGYGGGYGGYGGGYGSYGSGYGSYSGGFGGYGGGYGGYGSGYGAAGYDNRFIQSAEAATRPAFDSFQSVMEVMHSVLRMFDSTFQAVHASYGSVIGMADNISRLGSIFSIFNLFKGMNWLWRRIRRLIGLQNNPELEQAWAEATNLAQDANAAAPEVSRRSPGWTSLALIGLLISWPYLILKLLERMSPAKPRVIWDPVKQQGVKAEVVYDFQSGRPDELNVRRGQILMVAPKQFQNPNGGWILACDQTRKVGFVPGNYVMAQAAVQAKPLSTTNLEQSLFNSGPSTSTSNVLPTSLMSAAIPSTSQEPALPTTAVPAYGDTYLPTAPAAISTTQSTTVLPTYSDSNLPTVSPATADVTVANLPTVQAAIPTPAIPETLPTPDVTPTVLPTLPSQEMPILSEPMISYESPALSSVEEPSELGKVFDVSKSAME